jgi:hypothetical protein
LVFVTHGIVCTNSTGNVYKNETGKSSYFWAVAGGTIAAGVGTDLVTATWGNTGSGKISVGYFDPLQNCNTQPTNYNVTADQLPAAFMVTGGGSYCSGGSGVVIGLSDSENGASYQLKNGATNMGSPVQEVA